MMSPVDAVAGRVLEVYRRWRSDTPVSQRRRDWDDLFCSDEAEMRLERFAVAGRPAAWLRPRVVETGSAFLYLHGGGFQVGSIRSHADIAARIADASGATAPLVEYRMAPEHRFPAPVEDTAAAIRFLMTEARFAAERIALVGDSAGGNLALTGLLAHREAGGEDPGAVVLLSPWTDHAARGESYATRSALDPIHQRRMILHTAALYLGDADPLQPWASPTEAEVSQFPPTLIQVGDRETVLDDSRDFAAKLSAVGRDITCQVWPGMIHVFQQFPEQLVEARCAIDDIGAFLSSRIAVREARV
jgi:acetyl esterase/lipase